MLQQTQVLTVIPYYERFMARFPTVRALAEATVDEVLLYWSGLGYYARGRNLHRAAVCVMSDFGGVFPVERTALMTLPGVGRSTAAAIAVFSTGVPEAILDGNVKRVLCRTHAVEGFPGLPKVERALWGLATSLLPADEVGIYTQALMDLGATVCTRRRPLCVRCPLVQDCAAHATGRIDELPTAKPKKSRPKKDGRLWWVTNEYDEVWLERRPEGGSWGGLWCFPEISPVVPFLWRGTPECVRHEFTHFTWQLSIERMAIEGRAPLTEEGRWVPQHDLSALGFPAPIRALLALAPAGSERLRNF
jgi:A/G-specific adenine glycosylase